MLFRMCSRLLIVYNYILRSPAETASTVVANLPLACLTLATAAWVWRGASSQESPGARRLRAWAAKLKHHNRNEAASDALLTWLRAPGADPAGGQQWREAVGCPEVCRAWELLCGSIVQQFIYDTWYSAMTPDKDFPARVRAMLNEAFGRLAQRTKAVDLGAVLCDACDALMEQIDLYRGTRESLQAALAPGTSLADMTPDPRERAFQREMRAESNLHPALGTPCGHYLMLRCVARGAARLLLPRDVVPDGCPSFAVSSEMLAVGVFRPLMMYFRP